MPYMKNLEDKVALAYDHEVEKLKAVGWKILDAAEEEAVRLKLKADPELTSAAATEAQRVEAGVQEALAGVAKQATTEDDKPSEDEGKE